jgi:dipeptidyl aminopeptidase/acylaminoacyl peptidase
LPPALPVLGGADKIAFVANADIWMMNVDGSALKQLTFDGASKSDLQWLPDRETILFISGKTIKYYNITTDVVDTLTSFPSEVSVDAFEVSHDGKMVMVAMSNNIFVVPFNMDILKTITNRNQLARMEGVCITPVIKTPSALRVRDARWAADDKLVGWLFKGNDVNDATLQADQVGVYDITSCKPEFMSLKDYFPASRFKPSGYENREIPDFDWDGFDQFIFNTSTRNNGWGELYIYNWKTHKPTRSNTIDGHCCYRDARWSPDGTYVLFEFQDASLGSSAQILLYYEQVGSLNTGANFKHLPLLDGFFKNAKEAAQPALRPAK